MPVFRGKSNVCGFCRTDPCVCFNEEGKVQDRPLKPAVGLKKKAETKKTKKDSCMTWLLSLMALISLLLLIAILCRCVHLIIERYTN